MPDSVLVTGATRRIGDAIARAFSAAGHRVITHGRSNSGGAVPDVSFDLADFAAAEAALLKIVPLPQVLVLNASLFEPDSALAPDWAVYQRAMAANLEGNLRLIELFLRLAPPPRTIIVLLDQKVANLNPDFFSYTLTKSAMTAAVEMIGMAMTGGDRCYGLAPGLTQPSHDQTEEEFTRSATLNLLNRTNLPEEIGDAAVFLSRRLLANGSVMFCDSGQHLCRQRRDVMFQVRSA